MVYVSNLKIKKTLHQLNMFNLEFLGEICLQYCPSESFV